MPLALELAAARLRALPVREEEPDRRLFNRLAVFAGGWTVEAVEALARRHAAWFPDLAERAGREHGERWLSSR
jgi:hypothetical protein